MWVCIFQLRQLQNRQDQLLSMKKEAELRLQQAQARDNQGESSRVQAQDSYSELTRDN